MIGLLVLIGALAAATAFGLWRRSVDGKVHEVDTGAHAVDGHRDIEPSALPHLPPSALGEPLGEAATLVQFSSAFCQPCRATRQVLGQVSELVPGVTHVEIDAEQHLDLVRELHVMRTPTVFVLDSTGAIRKRASGTPRKADIIAALGEFVRI